MEGALHKIWSLPQGGMPSSAPPSRPNGEIPASRRVLSHVCGRGRVLGQAEVSERDAEGKSRFPVCKWETLVAKSGQDGRNAPNMSAARALDPGRELMDDVYVEEF